MMTISRWPQTVVHFVPALLLAGLLFALPDAHGKTLQWPDAPLSIHAQEQPLAEFLQDLFSAVGLRVLPGQSLSGRVSGHFDDRPDAIFAHLVKAYGLLPYFDGTVMHVSAAEDIVDRSVKLDPGDLERVVHALVRQQLADEHQSVTVLREQGLIKLRGAPEFVADVDELIRHTRAPKRAPRKLPAAQPVAQTFVNVPAAPNPVMFQTFRLRYASATDLSFFQGGREVTVPGVASLLRSMMGIGGSLLSRPATGAPPPGYSVPSLRGRGLKDQGLRQRGRDGHRSGAQRVAYDEYNNYDNTDDGSLVGAEVGRTRVTRIEADPNLNAVIVRDYAEAMPLYQGLIEQLDVEPLLVEIKVTIVDIDRGSLRDVGVNWNYSDRRNDIEFGGGDVLDQRGGLLLNTVLGDSGRFLARVNALAQTGSAQLVSRPQVLTLSNLEAVLTTDQSFFVRVAGNEEVDLFNVSVGTSLRVVPNVVGDPRDPQIRLLVSIEDGSLSPDQTVDDIPVVERSSLNTQAIIYNGESLLLGGLVRDSTSTNTTKVPLLGDVPGVGRLFRRDDEVTRAQERLFMITPRIVANQRGTPAGYDAPAGRREDYTAPPPGVRTQVRGATAQRRPEAYLDGF